MNQSFLEEGQTIPGVGVFSAACKKCGETFSFVSSDTGLAAAARKAHPQCSFANHRSAPLD